ncbi:hypothetical protein Q3G72_033738 [Acer saccharum]|nr:hypothetical protein Q3G72_033738 [Acer saccharum]
MPLIHCCLNPLPQLWMPLTQTLTRVLFLTKFLCSNLMGLFTPNFRIMYANLEKLSMAFVRHQGHGQNILYLLVYVDDIIITGNQSSAITSFIRALAAWFSLKDLGPLHYFLGVEATTTPHGLFLAQSKYIRDLLSSNNMLDAKLVTTPLSHTKTLKLHDGSPATDSTQYRHVLDSMQYLSLTRLDISFAVNKLS